MSTRNATDTETLALHAHDAPRLEPASPSRAARLAVRSGWLLWGLFAVAVVAAKLDAAPTPGHVVHIYHEAGRHFLAGESIYGSERFLYLPTSALLMAPLAALPFPVFGALWRLLNIGIFACGVRRLATAVDAAEVASGPETGLFFPATALALPLAWSAARHGQLTLAMGGLMMAAVVELHRRRWWRSAGLIALATALKPLAAPFLLLAGVRFPAVGRRALITLAAVLSAPFLFHPASYVVDQYAGFPGAMSGIAVRITEGNFSSFYTLLGAVGTHPSPEATRILAVVAGLLALPLFVRVARLQSPCAPVLMYTVVASYILLFNPGTERNTYALIAPSLALLLTHFSVEARSGAAGFVAVLMAVHVSSRPLAVVIPAALTLSRPLVCLALIGAVTVWSRPLQAARMLSHPA